MGCGRGTCGRNYRSRRLQWKGGSIAVHCSGYDCNAMGLPIVPLPLQSQAAVDNAPLRFTAVALRGSFQWHYDRQEPSSQVW
jgi:hypothetical protein